MRAIVKQKKGKTGAGRTAGDALVLAGREEDRLRIAELEAELAEARARVAALVEKGGAGSGSGMDSNGALAGTAVADVAARPEEVIGERAQGLEGKSTALEAANYELRSLTKNLDQIVRQRTRALAESEAQLRRKNAELDRLNRMKTEFIAIAAHELRTPMTTIVGYLDLIVGGRLEQIPADLRRPMSSLRRNAHRLKRLVDDMLDVSRLDAGQFSLRRRSVSLGEIANSVCDELKPFADQKHQTVIAEVAPTPDVDADPDKIHQVITNLAVNSIKYTPAGGEVRVRVDSVAADPEAAAGAPAAAPRARIRVWDNGIGITPELRVHLFEPFTDIFAAKYHTSSGPDSAGLGLRIARGIVELHGGSITVNSDEGKFTEFTVLLPLARPSGSESAPADQTPQV